MSSLGIFCKTFFSLLFTIPKCSPICRIPTCCIVNLTTGCCQPMIIPFNESNVVEGARCCSPISYNRKTHLCFIGEVYSTQGVCAPACCGCGPNIYTQNSSIFCQGVSHPIGNLSKPHCCGTAVYDAENAICCNGVLQSKRGIAKPKCCGFVPIDGRFQKCCIGIMCPL